MSNWTIITGATGFIGGEWTLRALQEGKNVIALCRVGRESAVENNLTNIASSYGFPLPDLSKLMIIPWEPGHESESIQKMRDNGAEKIDCVVHSAAEMSYSLNKLPKSFENNLQMGAGLYKAIRDLVPEAKKFIMISTAYTCGLKPSEKILEEAHLIPNLINGYQVSKWATEMALSNLAEKEGPELIVVRPSIVVGDHNRGIYTGKCFGFYMFLRGFALAKKLGCKNLNVNINQDGEINLIPINQLIDLLMAIESDKKSKENVRYIHATTKDGLKVHDILNLISKIYGLSINNGEAKSVTDYIFQKQVSPNLAFANTVFKFDNSSAQNLVKSSLWDTLDLQTLEKIVRYSKALYYQKASFEKSDMEIIPQLIPRRLKNLIKRPSLS